MQEGSPNPGLKISGFTYVRPSISRHGSSEDNDMKVIRRKKHMTKRGSQGAADKGRDMEAEEVGNPTASALKDAVDEDPELPAPDVYAYGNDTNNDANQDNA
jgi:hypothetical protein